MRFQKPDGVVQDVSNNAVVCSADVEDFCVPADKVWRKGCQWDPERKCCFRNNCDALFTPAPLRQQQKNWTKDAHPRVIIAAGPERSGSTWLFNCIRLLFEHAQRPLDCYYLSSITDKALDSRKAGEPYQHHVLIKTHAWSDDWVIERSNHIFVTHRDLRQVLASYRRMNWEFELPSAYVEDHMKWRKHAELDIAFEDIIGQPLSVIQELARRLDLAHLVNVKDVLGAVSTLPVPEDWVDPVTQIWPSHISEYYNQTRQRAAEDPEDLSNAMTAGIQPGTPNETVSKDLKTRFPEFYNVYGDY